MASDDIDRFSTGEEYPRQGPRRTRSLDHPPPDLLNNGSLHLLQQQQQQQQQQLPQQPQQQPQQQMYSSRQLKQGVSGTEPSRTSRPAGIPPLPPSPQMPFSSRNKSGVQAVTPTPNPAPINPYAQSRDDDRLQNMLGFINSGNRLRPSAGTNPSIGAGVGPAGIAEDGQWAHNMARGGGLGFGSGSRDELGWRPPHSQGSLSLSVSSLSRATSAPPLGSPMLKISDFPDLVQNMSLLSTPEHSPLFSPLTLGSAGSSPDSVSVKEKEKGPVGGDNDKEKKAGAGVGGMGAGAGRTRLSRTSSCPPLGDLDDEEQLFGNNSDGDADTGGSGQDESRLSYGNKRKRLLGGNGLPLTASQPQLHKNNVPGDQRKDTWANGEEPEDNGQGEEGEGDRRDATTTQSGGGSMSEGGSRDGGQAPGRGSSKSSQKAGRGDSRTVSSAGTGGEKEFIHVRARRGQATDSHSLAERVRREKISDRMKVLQDLVPTCSKVIGKAQMLEEIINYVRSLQMQVEILSSKLAAIDTNANSESRLGIHPGFDGGHSLGQDRSKQQKQQQMLAEIGIIGAGMREVDALATMSYGGLSEYRRQESGVGSQGGVAPSLADVDAEARLQELLLARSTRGIRSLALNSSLHSSGGSINSQFQGGEHGFHDSAELVQRAAASPGWLDDLDTSYSYGSMSVDDHHHQQRSIHGQQQQQRGSHSFDMTKMEPHF